MGLTCLIILVVSTGTQMLHVSAQATTTTVKSSICWQGVQHNVLLSCINNMPGTWLSVLAAGQQAGPLMSDLTMLKYRLGHS